MVVQSPLKGKYETAIDRDSAYERLRAREKAAADELAKAESASANTDLRIDPDEFKKARRYDGGSRSDEGKTKRTSSSRSDSIGETFAKSFARQLGSKTGQAIVRGVLGSIFKSR